MLQTRQATGMGELPKSAGGEKKVLDQSFGDADI
jgi:hypothetical protein